MQPLARLYRVTCLLVLCTALAGCAASPPAQPGNICSIFEEHRAWYRAARKAEKRWGTPKHIAMAIINQESSFRHDARPPRRWLLGIIPWKRPSSAYGYAQAIDGTWAQYLRATGSWGRDRDDFADAIDFVHWHMYEAIVRNAVARNDARAMYLNYHEGWNGFRSRSYRKKPWLESVARRVQRRAQQYEKQYATCRNSLKPSFFERLFWG